MVVSLVTDHVPKQEEDGRSEGAVENAKSRFQVGLRAAKAQTLAPVRAGRWVMNRDEPRPSGRRPSNGPLADMNGEPNKGTEFTQSMSPEDTSGAVVGTLRTTRTCRTQSWRRPSPWSPDRRGPSIFVGFIKKEPKSMVPSSSPRKSLCAGLVADHSSCNFSEPE
jgi:hypothetical protein